MYIRVSITDRERSGKTAVVTSAVVRMLLTITTSVQTDAVNSTMCLLVAHTLLILKIPHVVVYLSAACQEPRDQSPAAPARFHKGSLDLSPDMADHQVP